MFDGRLLVHTRQPEQVLDNLPESVTFPGDTT
jgi:hypothetical protein